jgi:hypothetical protein
MRDLSQVIEHVHDAEIEIGEGPEPPRRDFRAASAGRLPPSQGSPAERGWQHGLARKGVLHTCAPANRV